MTAKFVAIRERNRMVVKNWRRICRQAAECFKHTRPEIISLLFAHCNRYNHPDVLCLKRFIQALGFWDLVCVRLRSWQLGLLSKVFDPRTLDY